MEHTRVPKSAAETGRKGDWTGGGSDGCIRVYLVAKGSEVLALSPAAMPAASHTRVLHVLPAARAGLRGRSLRRRN